MYSHEIALATWEKAGLKTFQFSDAEWAKVEAYAKGCYEQWQAECKKLGREQDFLKFFGDIIADRKGWPSKPPPWKIYLPDGLSVPVTYPYPQPYLATSSWKKGEGPFYQYPAPK